MHAAPFGQHNHQSCIDVAVEQAHTLCAAAGVKLTSQRLNVLKLIWQNHKPLGAYTLMSMLESSNGQRVAPPTVYRALDFLLEQGLIHRVHSLNAFIGCTRPGHQHEGNLLICRRCGVAQELESNSLLSALRGAAEEQAFTVDQLMVEIVGLCPNCQTAQPEEPVECLL